MLSMSVRVCDSQDARDGKEGTYSFGGASDKTLHRPRLGSDKMAKSTNRISKYSMRDNDATGVDRSVAGAFNFS
jgi:hypothetical protein